MLDFFLLFFSGSIRYTPTFIIEPEHFTKLLYMFHSCLRHLAEDKLPEGINDLWHGNTSYPLLSFWQHTLHDLP
jgi:hypothetical protein